MSSLSKTLWVLLAVVMLCASVVLANESVTVTRNLTSMPLAFTENQGQWDELVLFRANAGGATMWFTKDGAVYQFTRRVPTNPVIMGAPQLAVGSDAYSGRQTPPSAPDAMGGPQLAVGLDRFDHQPDSIETIVIKASFIGANPNPQMVGSDMMEYKCNYFIGNDPDKWRTDVPNYQAIVVEDVYPGIDLRYSGAGNGGITYEFVAAQGADLSQIEVAYEGEAETSLDA